ncbi:MAG: DNA polymerase III subunit beta [Candidatus Altimarinota bacterium]
MKFQIETLTLKTALDTVNHATASISTTPILENILIKVNFSNIVFTANNLEMAIEHIVSQNIKIENEGAFCIPSKIFTNYISLLEDDNVHLELLNDNSLEIKTETSKIKIKGNPASDFPLIPGIKENSHFTLKSEIIKKSIEKTLFSAAEGNIRPTLAGIFVNINENVAKFATTDSFRMSEYKVETGENISGNFSQIIPSKTAFELRSLLGEKTDIKVIVGENQIGFIFGNTKFYSRLLNGKFPDYEGFFPASYNTRAVINKFDLMSGLKKINLLSRETNYSIKMSISNETGILIETSQTQIGEARINLVGSIEGEEAIVGLNSEYLLEALGAIEASHISISFESPLSPILITGISEDNKKDGFRHIIMPLKI